MRWEVLGVIRKQKGVQCDWGVYKSDGEAGLEIEASAPQWQCDG